MTITVHNFDGDYSLTFYTGELTVDDTIRAAGHEPNGYFWEGLVQFAWPTIADRLDFDSESGMFAVNGTRADLEALRHELTPVLASPAAVQDLIERAGSAGFAFND